MKNYHIAVFDLGKTNKKLLIYDQDLALLDQSSTQVEELAKEGYRAENVEEIFDWYKLRLKELSSRFNIGAISVSSHGATFVALNQRGGLAFPVVSYTTEPGDDFHRKFFSEFGDPSKLQKTTASAELKALINIGQGIYFIRENFPSAYRNIKGFLNYPQYYGFLMTGRAGIEKTYLGSHTYLWDYEKNEWSTVARGLGADRLFPKNFQRPWDVLGKISDEFASQTGLNPETIVTLGIHDSNGSLLPYIISGLKNFILNSTGTWCVVMRPEDQVNFKEEELGKTVFYNISAFEQPVKTAIFMGGEEFAVYDAMIRKTFQNKEYPQYDQELYQKIITEQRLFVLPSVVKGAGQFPDSDARIVSDNHSTLLEALSEQKVKELFSSNQEFYAALNISLALQTEVALQRAGMEIGMTVFVEGGFRRNDPYNRLLTALFPDSTICLTELQEASALGAAILAKAALENTDPMSMRDLMNIKFEPVSKTSLKELTSYRERFLHLIG